MKMKILSVLCVAVLGLGTATPAVARTDPDVAFFDAILGRPVGLAATVVGGAVFVVCLPFAATSGSIKPTADALVGKPARFTFTRPLGDFSYPHQPHPELAGKEKAKPVTAKQNRLIAQAGSH
jgi:hypothetical protein